MPVGDQLDPCATPGPWLGRWPGSPFGAPGLGLVCANLWGRHLLAPLGRAGGGEGRGPETLRTRQHFRNKHLTA